MTPYQQRRRAQRIGYATVIVLFVLIAVIMLAGCKKDDPPAPVPACEREHTGTVRVVNNASATWLLFIGAEVVDTLPAYQETTWTLPVASYAVHAISFPTNASATINVVQCAQQTWNLP